MGKLTTRLEQLEAEIEFGIRSIGKNLLEIHNTKAYQEQYETFEVYCKTRWDFSDRHARRIIEAEIVRVKIGHLCPVEKLKTQHLLAISEVPPAKQAQVTAAVIARCEDENRKPTEKDFKAAAKEYIKPKPDPKPVLIQDALEETEEEAVTVPKKVKSGGGGSKTEKTDSPEDAAKKVKSLADQYRDKLVRAIDDYHQHKPNAKERDRLVKVVQGVSLW